MHLSWANVCVHCDKCDKSFPFVNIVWTLWNNYVFYFLSLHFLIVSCQLFHLTQNSADKDEVDFHDIGLSKSFHTVFLQCAHRFVTSSLQNKLFPQTFTIILKYLMSCGE